MVPNLGWPPRSQQEVIEFISPPVGYMTPPRIRSFVCQVCFGFVGASRAYMWAHMWPRRDLYVSISNRHPDTKLPTKFLNRINEDGSSDFSWRANHNGSRGLWNWGAETTVLGISWLLMTAYTSGLVSDARKLISTVQPEKTQHQYSRGQNRGYYRWSLKIWKINLHLCYYSNST